MNTNLYKLMNWARIEGIVYSEEDQPHDILGRQIVKAGTLIQTMQPGADKVTLVRQDNHKHIEMEMADEEGFFAALIKDKSDFEYHYLVHKGQSEKIVEEPYNFESTISKRDLERFGAGIHYSVYDDLGAHPKTINGVKGTAFAVWAPNAIRVSVVGDFNQWDGRVHPMRRLGESGVFELFIPGVADGDLYKFEIKLKGGLVIMKSDPYAFGMELRPDTASIVRNLEGFEWTDQKWMSIRKERQTGDIPFSVYELHLASFRKPDDDRMFYNYREIAPMLAEYIEKMGYTHVELMPVMEHPLDLSWGYQTIGYYAPTSRYGTAEDFMYFMNYMHEKEIGVILDWVPAHFPRDTHGLSNFDGTCLYEHMDKRQGEHPHWGTLLYNYGRPQVSNYLIANALYWTRYYHADGIRIDAVASMLYLDYGKNDGEWVANIYGGNENLEAMEFLKHLNSIMKKSDPTVLMIAEESTAWPMVTGDLKDGGLGFDYKWNMGWMNDFLGYMRYEPYFRTHHYGELTFSMIYAYSERFILSLSHDEVVHGKASLIGKMPGERTTQFANLRASYGYFMTHPGKKLLFMGQDLAEYDEWNEERSVEWELLQYDEHKQINEFMKDLLHLYREHPALYEMDHQSAGFEWINNISANENILVYLRNSHQQEEQLLIVCNFGDLSYDHYKIGVPVQGKYKEILNSDAEIYGGSGFTNPRLKQSKADECDHRENSIRIKVAPLSIMIFKLKKDQDVLTDNETAKAKKKTVKTKKLKETLKSKYEKEREQLL
ncbi:MAG: 1,4-alpha-glucan branching protein GlgB [Clostridia bacterium]|nr:1,4-alpha-glucan branching protein GlgB [Clostridia bacterium]